MNVITPTSLAATYRESLPDECPPGDALDTCEMLVLRLVPSESPTEQDFDSYAKLGKEPPKDMCGCRWASCSVFKASQGEHIPAAMKKLPAVRKKLLSHIAEIKLDSNAGKFKSSATGNGHIDLWLYASFSPSSAITTVREI